MKELIENLSNFLEVKVELIKLELEEDLAELASRLILTLVVVSFVFLGLLAGTIGVSRFLNELLHSNYLGYMLITLLYFLVALVLHVLNKYFRLGRNVKLYILRILESQSQEENGNKT